MIRRLRVRMYRVGFGDCFLLSFDGDEGPRHVLIDCGSITENDQRLAQVVADIVAECTPPGGGAPRLELVVGTHRHRDHVKGFKNPAWANVEVGEVWMPWTEDPGDAAARDLLQRQSGFALALAATLSPAAASLDDDPLSGLGPGANPTAAETVQAAARNALSNEAAMTTLHRGFAGRPPRRFLPTKDTVCEARSLPNLAGLKIHVLGPPRSEAAMASMRPPEGESYLARRARAGAGPGSQAEAFGMREKDPEGAFRASWRIAPEVFKHEDTSTFGPDDEGKVRDMAEEPDADLAAAIDRAVNNTSLVLAFEVADQWLLFPGDAQWGSWDAALRDPASRRVLEQTTVYKIGHHGSENATPRELVDKVMPPSVVALLSTCAVAQWPMIPRQPLLDAMTERQATIVRSDAPAAPAGAAFRATALYTEWTVDLPA